MALKLPFPIKLPTFSRGKTEKSGKRWLWLSLYGVVMFSLFFGVHYLSANIDPMLRKALGNVTAITIQPGPMTFEPMPPKLSMPYCFIRQSPKAPVMLDMRNVSIKLSLLKLLSLKGAVDVEAKLLGGSIVGNIGTGSFFRTSRVSTDVVLEGINAAAVPFLKRFDSSIGGRIDLALEFDGNPNSSDTWEGQARLRVSNGKMANLVPLIRLPNLKDVSLNGVASIDANVFDFSQLEMDVADGLNVSLRGTFALDMNQIGSSVVNMQGEVRTNPKIVAMTLLDKRAVALINQKKPVRFTATGPLRTAKLKMQ